MDFAVIDADGHVAESWEQIARRLDEPFRQRPLQTPLCPQDGWDRRLLGTTGDWAGDAKSWTAALADRGMSAAVLFPTLSLYVGFVRDADWAVALACAYNPMVYKDLASQSSRLKTVALLPIQDPAASARELERRVDELGCVGAMLSADAHGLPGGARFDPIYEVAQRLRVPVWVHAGATDTGVSGGEPFPTFIQAHMCSHAFAPLRQITSMFFDGVPERFAELTIAYLEAGSGWLPYSLQRMDQEWEKRGAAETPLLRRPPTEYLHSGRVYLSCEADEPPLPQALGYIGDDHVVYASDFPHWDHSFPKSVAELKGRPDLSDTQKRKVLADNARRLYRPAEPAPGPRPEPPREGASQHRAKCPIAPRKFREAAAGPDSSQGQGPHMHMCARTPVRLRTRTLERGPRHSFPMQTASAAPRAFSTRIGRGLLLASLLAVAAACGRSPEANAPAQPPAVTVVAATRQSVPVYGRYVGQTEAVKTVEARARVEGFIERQVAADGATVKAGDVLFVIDPRPFEVTLNQVQSNLARDVAQLRQSEATLVQREADVRAAQANVDRDQAQLENWRTQEERYRTLLKQELIAREQYDQIRTSMVAMDASVQANRAALENSRAALAVGRAGIENARAVVRAGESAVESARLQLGYTTVRSPLDGRMGRAEVRVGSFVGKNDATLLATVSTLDPMYVTFSVSEREALSVWRRRQTELRARPDASGIALTLPDDSAYPGGGRLDFVDRTIDPRTGTLALRASFPNPDGLLSPGQYVRLRILLEERPDAVVVPQAAVQESQGSTTVFVIGKSQTVEARAVKMGPRLGRLWVVDDGIKPGEQVVVKGLQQVRAGSKVTPTVEPMPSAAGS